MTKLKLLSDSFTANVNRNYDTKSQTHLKTSNILKEIFPFSLQRNYKHIANEEITMLDDKAFETDEVVLCIFNLYP